MVLVMALMLWSLAIGLIARILRLPLELPIGCVGSISPLVLVLCTDLGILRHRIIVVVRNLEIIIVEIPLIIMIIMLLHHVWALASAHVLLVLVGLLMAASIVLVIWILVVSMVLHVVLAPRTTPRSEVASASALAMVLTVIVAMLTLATLALTTAATIPLIMILVVLVMRLVMFAHLFLCIYFCANLKILTKTMILFTLFIKS